MKPFAGIMPRKMTDEELVAAIRQDIAAEEEAANLYLGHRMATDNEEARKVLKNIADEELAHIGEFLVLETKLAPEDRQHIQEGGFEAIHELGMSIDELIAHAIPEAEGLGGIMVNEAVARTGPCTCYGNIYFHKGIIGSLNKSERELYCKEVEHKTSPAMTARLEKWDQAKDVCKAAIKDLPKGDRLVKYVSCMGIELANRGIEI